MLSTTDHADTCTWNEVCAPVPGFVEQYEVSTLGRVRNKAGRVRKSTRLPTGHVYVDLWKQNRSTRMYVHRIVMFAFGPKPMAGEEVRHLNGDPADNRFENLRWGSRSQNVMDEVRSGRHWQVRKTHCKHGHEFTPENTYVRRAAGKNPSRGCKACRRIAQTKKPSERP